MIALIDGDIIVYQSAARAQHVFDFDDDIVHITGSKRETREGIDSMVEDLKKAVGADRAVLAFTCTEGNFRKDVYPKYKENRKGHVKPVTWAYGREYALTQYESMTRPTLEADDILAILATGSVRGYAGPKVVCSIDKDMRTFPCSLYNWMKPEDGVVKVSTADADFAFYLQVLTGDSVDGYPGCPGIGPVRAARMLEPLFDSGIYDHAEVWAAVVEAYAKKGLVEYDAITQARCARILRAEDYNFSEKRPLLWTPPREED